MVLHSAPASLADPDNRFIAMATDAMERLFGKKTVYIRSGGSIPIVGTFATGMGMPSVMMGGDLGINRNGFLRTGTLPSWAIVSLVVPECACVSGE